MPIIEKTFWLIAIAITFANAYLLWSRSKVEVERHPELRAGYGRLLRGYLICLNLPWLVMGLGILVGGAETVFDYFDPRSGNLFVLAFHAIVLSLWILSIFWIYFSSGAEFLVKHPGVLNSDIRSPVLIKLLFGVMLLGGMAAEIAMWSGRYPVLRPPH